MVSVHACLMCGATFPVGGSSGLSKRRRYCSSICAARARMRKGKRARILNDRDAAYLAGVIDANGRLGFYSRDGKIAVRLAVRNNSKQLFDWIMARTGVGALHANQYAGWNWWCSAEAATSVLEQVRRFLQVQTKQAELAIQVQRKLHDPRESTDPVWQDEVRRQMHAYNGEEEGAPGRISRRAYATNV